MILAVLFKESQKHTYSVDPSFFKFYPSFHPLYSVFFLFLLPVFPTILSFFRPGQFSARQGSVMTPFTAILLSDLAFLPITLLFFPSLFFPISCLP
ncbi:hypothetical protein DFS34DRAFT_635797 [Phlyctochytrium arcticum]|nr:hypothetical protein DFS34DRAFT_635797 [Phlyctochytrium arcticum]